MELTNDNKIIIYGSISILNADKLFLYKYNPDGRRDVSWASNGQKLLTTGRTVNSIQLKTQKDGKILFVYGFFFESPTDNASDISIQRLLPNGLPDNSFGYSGSRIIDVNQNNDYTRHVRIQDDGKILLINETIIATSPKLSVVRLLPDGKTDPTYLNGIKTIISTTASVDVNNVLLKSDNKLLIAGNVHVNIFSSSAGLLQLKSNGAIDGNFASNGIYLNPFSTEQAIGVDVNLQSDGKLLFTCRDFGNYTGENINIRLFANGRLDRSFAVNGQS